MDRVFGDDRLDVGRDIFRVARTCMVATLQRSRAVRTTLGAMRLALVDPLRRGATTARMTGFAARFFASFLRGWLLMRGRHAGRRGGRRDGGALPLGLPQLPGQFEQRENHSLFAQREDRSRLFRREVRPECDVEFQNGCGGHDHAHSPSCERTMS